MPGPGGSVSGPDNKVYTNGSNGSVVFNNTTDVERIVDPTLDASTVAVYVETGKLYIGFSDDVDSVNGFPIVAQNGLVLTLDTSVQSLYGIADTAPTDVRWVVLD